MENKRYQEISEALILDKSLVKKIERLLLSEEPSTEYSFVPIEAKPFHWEYEHEEEDTILHAKILEYTGGVKTLYDVLLRNETTRQGYVIREQFLEEVINIRNRFIDNRNVHLYLRQSFLDDERNYLMLDDLSRESVEKMFRYGFEPSLVTETSKDNYQAVLRFSEYKKMDVIAHAHYILKKIFDADILCDCHDHFMRMAGSLNVKDDYIQSVTDEPFRTRVVYFDSPEIPRSFSQENSLFDIVDITMKTLLNDQPDITSEIVSRRIDDSFVSRGNKKSL